MSAALPNAEALIAEATETGNQVSPGDDDWHRRMALASEVGALRARVRILCADLAHAKSADGIAESIARLPSRHADLTVVLKAGRERIDAEDASGQWTGMDTVAECLSDAVGAMDDCYAVDMDAERTSYAYAKAQDERAELRGGAYAAALRATR